MIHIIGSPSSNAKAVYYAYRELKIECKIVDDPTELIHSKKVILPGVGAFGALSAFLYESNLANTLQVLVNQGVKLLGICLGMQILGISSEESVDVRGLEFLQTHCRKFDVLELRVPHTGWDQVSIYEYHEVLDGLSSDFSAYFSHSYYLPIQESLTLGSTNYGIPFTSIVAANNVFGVQFHPERSQFSGIKILSNFAEW